MDTTFKMAGRSIPNDKGALYKFVGGVKLNQVPVLRSSKINYGDRKSGGMLLRVLDHRDAKLVDLVQLSAAADVLGFGKHLGSNVKICGLYLFHLVLTLR